MFQIIRHPIKTIVRTNVCQEDAEYIAFTWGFLIPLGATWDKDHLAGAIEAYCSHPKAKYIANFLRSLDPNGYRLSLESGS